MLPSRILIANRGEIACRVIAACHELGVEAVAVYSDADAGALHVRLADHAMPIGGTSASESYLRGDRIIAAARASGATAIHPGYGFLSENADFAAACAGSGLLFIGPPPEAIRRLGDKIAAKELAERVGVPILADYRGADQRPEALAREAARIGYPVLIKAAAGGGGRGMRVAPHEDELAGAVEAAAREAGRSFGDPRVFLERYLARPRHVEVQILADSQGAVLAIGERECSMQRRYQKVIEEAPSPAVDPTLRQRLCEAATMLARAAGYVNAGTVEFLLDGQGHFYFLEMNTRLQVEHPVTELVSGCDLVVAQIRIAAGEPLPRTQREVTLRGHAIEVRLYAEDPGQRFTPATGTLHDIDLPHLPGVRIDSGVATGDVVGPHYDPMLAKIIAHAETRAGALARLREALRRCHILGVTTNRAYLQRILAHPAFAAADLSTRFLEEHEQDLLPEAQTPDTGAWLAAALVLAGEPAPAASQRGAPVPSTTLWFGFGPWRHSAGGLTLRIQHDGQRRAIYLRARSQEQWETRLEGEERLLTAVWHDANLRIVDGESVRDWRVARSNGTVWLDDAARSFRFSFVPPPTSAALADRAGSADLRAPMPGTVVKLHVREGERVAQRQPLLVLEAMKMEHVIAAPYAGIVRRLPYGPGALAPADAVLAELEEL